MDPLSYFLDVYHYINHSRMRVTIPIDLSTRTFIPLPRFYNSRREPHLLTYSFSCLIYGTICLSVTWCAFILKALSAGHNSSGVKFVHLDLSFCLFWCKVRRICTNTSNDNDDHTSSFSILSGTCWVPIFPTHRFYAHHSSDVTFVPSRISPFIYKNVFPMLCGRKTGYSPTYYEARNRELNRRLIYECRC
jgi:hypothetical protein